MGWLPNSWGGILALCAGTGIALAVYGYRLKDRLRLRHIPAAPLAAWLLGHLQAFARRPMYLCYEAWSRQLGGIFLVFLGKEPVVVISDPELVRQVCVRHFAQMRDRPNFVNPPNWSRDKRIRMIQSGLLVAKGAYWASLRAAVQPLFHTAALQGYAPIMNECISQLLAKLDAAAAEGEAVDIHALAGGMTLEVVGRACFGVDLRRDGGLSAAEQDAQRRANIPNLPAALRIVFTRTSFTSAGVGLLFRLVPKWAEGLLFHLAFRAWGSAGRDLEYARTSLCTISDSLLQNAAARAEAAGQAVAMRPTDWRWWQPEWAQRHCYRGAVPSEASAIDMLLRATNRETGAGLADYQIVAQCNTLIAAGFETTANALSFTLYLLATHPEAEARVAEEVDAFGRDEAPTYDNLARFPYISACINEALRIYPPAHTTTREATADCTISDGRGRSFLLPRGTWVHIAVWAIHRDPGSWPEPDAFRPERFLEGGDAGRHPAAYLPFGMGPRNCVGARFAQEELQLALVRLYQRFTFRLDPSRPQAPLRLRMGITLAPADGVWLTPRRRS